MIYFGKSDFERKFLNTPNTRFFGKTDFLYCIIVFYVLNITRNNYY